MRRWYGVLVAWEKETVLWTGWGGGDREGGDGGVAYGQLGGGDGTYDEAVPPERVAPVSPSAVRRVVLVKARRA